MNQSPDAIAQKLLAFLSAQRQEPALDYVVPPTQLQGGYETHVYRFQLNNTEGGRLTQPLILRLYPARFGAGNAVRESTVQTVLAESGYPVQDLATTLVLMTIPAKQIGPTLGLDFSPTGIAAFVQRYLAAYQTAHPLDLTYLAYYQALRCISALIEGVEGQTVWQQPTVVADLIESIQSITGVPLQRTAE